MTSPTPLGSKIGFSNNIDTNEFVILSNADVVNPSGQQAQVVSTSVSDSSVGTGIQKVKITFFDTNWVLNSEMVVTNGKTPVLTDATNIFRIEAFEAFQAGSGQFAAGTITLTDITGITLFAQIDPHYTTFNRALHFVAPGNVANIIDITANCPSASGITFIVFVTKDNSLDGGSQVIIPDISFLLKSDTVHIDLSVPTHVSLALPLVCDASNSTVGLQIGILVKGLASSQIGIASFHYIEVKH
jgi:hypothetical protein